MIKVRQVKTNIDKNENLKTKVAQKLKVKEQDIISLKISKKSIDARNKENICFVYEVIITLKNETLFLNKNKNKDILEYKEQKYVYPKGGNNSRVIVVGSGPAGLFCAYALGQNGYKPLIIERGEKIEDRVKTVNEFWESGKLNKNSNVQFGEGGAGTFSDGKLNTLVKDKECRMQKVFETFVDNGAPEEILYLNKPHIGTDLLRNVIVNMRKQIIKMGGTFRYNTCLTDLIIRGNELKEIEVNNNEILDCDKLVLALGHSARDTFELLYKKQLKITSKPFAVGVRIQHPQKTIDLAQYGFLGDLPPASYKLTTNINERGVYSFCMCPGGYVVNASSEEKRLVINGMSNHQRDSENANSALVVTVSSKDYGDHPLAGIEYQRKLETKAYGTNGKIPVQLFKDFKENKKTTAFGHINPIFKGQYEFANLGEILPDYVYNCLKEAIDNFDKKIKGYADDDAILAGIETRTSSPIRIERNENFVSNIINIYPAGEGAGYAGGITTSAIDGLKVAEAIIKFDNKN